MNDSEYQPAERGDIFADRQGAIVTVTRASRAHGWADIAVWQNGSVAWTKRMPKGIPASWSRYPR